MASREMKKLGSRNAFGFQLGGVQFQKKSYTLRRTGNIPTKTTPRIANSAGHFGEQQGQSPEIEGGSAILAGSATASPLVNARFEGRPARRILYNRAR